MAHYRANDCCKGQDDRSVSTPAAPNSDENERAFPSSADRPVRSSPTVPPRPVPWLPMAMADLTRAVGIASRRARAQGSQPASPVGDVGKCKQLRELLSRTPIAVGIAMQLPIDWRTEKHVLCAPNHSLRSQAAQGRRSSCKKVAAYAPRKGASPRWWCSGHVYDGGRASMWRLRVRALCP